MPKLVVLYPQPADPIEFEKLFMEAWSLSRHETKKDFLEEAIRIYVGLHAQAQVRSLRGKLAGNGNLDDPREGGGADPR